jgi:hypothetical protein
MAELGDRQLPPWLDVSTGGVPADATVVNGDACRTRMGLFAEWARALRLPEHFGHNWDAFADSLRDQLPDEAAPVVVENAQHLLAEEAPHQLATLLTVLGDIADGRPALRVVLVAPPAEGEELRRRVFAASRGIRLGADA